MHPKPLVIYYNNIPAPYMVERFNIIADRKNVRLEAWFNDRKESDRSWTINESTWRFPYRYVPKIIIAGKTFHFPFLCLMKTRPDFIVSLYAEPSFLTCWVIAKLLKIKAGFRAVTTFETWVKRNKLKEALKKAIFSRVDFILTEGRDGKNFVMRYGTPSNRIFFARHGVNISFFQKNSNLRKTERQRIRESLRLRGTTFLYVGRLVKKKGLQYLVEAFRKLKIKSNAEVTLIIVGDGSDENEFKQQCKIKGIHDVVFAGFQNRKNLAKIYGASDVFVFPSLGDPYGLVVDEAMACKLPIITTDSVGEIKERVFNRRNGYIVPSGDNDLLADAMFNFVERPNQIEKMGKCSERIISGHTVEKWVVDFEKVVFQLSKVDN